MSLAKIRQENVITAGIETLVIDRKTSHCFLQKDDQLLNTTLWIHQQQCLVYGIIGIMNHAGKNFLGVITDCQEVGVLNRAKVFKVTQVKLLPFQEESDSQFQEALNNVAAYLLDGFYFSFGYDLTCSRQRRI